MKRLIFIFTIAVLMTTACDTVKSNQAPETTAEQATYVSPTVHAMKAPTQALSADSIPTSYTIKGAVIAPAEFQPMMGRWVSTFDNKEVVQFTPGRYTSFYNGEKIAEEHMTYYQVCPDHCSGAVELGKPCFILASEFGQTCFAIVKHSSSELELTMLGSELVNLAYVKE